jgi:hypothetical protein
MALDTVPAAGTKPQGLYNVPPTKTYKASDGNVAEKLRYDVMGYTIDAVRELMVYIAEDETEQQMSIDNPPAFVNVDNVRGKSVLDAQKTITITFGTRLQLAALNQLRAALAKAIGASTTTRTGKLANEANWVFRYVRDGRVQPLPLAGGSGIPMGPKDFIVLMPAGVINDKNQAYATAVNMRVAGSGKLTFRRSKKGRETRKNQSIGFLALAARAANASPGFQGFHVTAGFTVRHAIPGEVTRIAGPRSGFIKIRPATGRGAR